MLYLTSRKLSGEHDGVNHTIPVFEVLEVDDNPDLCIIVTPLMRACDDPWFGNMGEAADFIGQVLEASWLPSLRTCRDSRILFIQGMKLMHAHGVAHRNPQLDGDAIMYDPTLCYPEGFHPVMTKTNRCFTSEAFHYSRTEKPVTYYFTDFRTAKRYHTHPTPPTAHHRTQQGTRTKRRQKFVGTSRVRDYPLRWGNNFAPEFKRPEKKCNPFKVDVYLLGVEISRRFLEVRDYLELIVEDIASLIPRILNRNIEGLNG